MALSRVTEEVGRPGPPVRRLVLREVLFPGAAAVAVAALDVGGPLLAGVTILVPGLLGGRVLALQGRQLHHTICGWFQNRTVG